MAKSYIDNFQRYLLKPKCIQSNWDLDRLYKDLEPCTYSIRPRVLINWSPCSSSSSIGQSSFVVHMSETRGMIIDGFTFLNIFRTQLRSLGPPAATNMDKRKTAGFYCRRFTQNKRFDSLYILDQKWRFTINYSSETCPNNQRQDRVFLNRNQFPCLISGMFNLETLWLGSW